MKLELRWVIGLLIVTSGGISGCDARDASPGNDGDALEALETSTVSELYDERYWGERRRDDPDLWARATEYCDGKDGNQHPNCRPVLSLLLLERTLDRPRTTSPGIEGSLDMRELQDSAQSRLDSLRVPN